jgi:ABC-type transporter Mla MlaB component
MTEPIVGTSAEVPPWLALAGPVTIGEVAGHRAALLETMGRGRGLVIDLERAGPWDVAGLQLLLSVLASGRESGSPARLANIPGVLQDLARRAGLLDRLEAACDDPAQKHETAARTG